MLLNRNTSSGYGDFPPTFLVHCADYLCVPLTFILNMCISTGTYPDLLKRSNITPIYKQKGSKKRC